MNYSWARKTAQTGFAAAGAVLVAGAGTAHAYGNDIKTSDQIGALSGNQVVAPVQAPINICGVAAAVLGTGAAGCEGGSEASFGGPNGDLSTHDNTGLGNGNQAYAPIQVPTEVSGIAAAAGGASDAWSNGGSNATIEESGHNAESDVVTKDNIGALSGNQLLAPIQAPINACGNAASILGAASAECEGGANAEFNGPGGDLRTHDNTGLGNGNQIYAPIQTPINVCGNAVAILGSASASCEGGADAGSEEPKDDNHHGGHKKTGYTESSDSASTESANVDVAEEQLPIGGVPGLDTVTGTAGSVAGELPVVGGLINSNVTPGDAAATATDTVGEVTELAGAGLL